LIADYKKI